MAFYGDLVTAIDAEIFRRIQGGGVDQYGIGGDEITLIPFDKLCELRERYASLALQESGQARKNILAKLEPFR